MGGKQAEGDFEGVAVKQLDLLDNMPMGKYKDKLVGSVIEYDPMYIRWMIDNTDWQLNEAAVKYLEEYE